MAASLVTLMVAAATASGQQESSKSSDRERSKDQAKSSEKERSQDRGPVVRTFGSEGSYRTEVSTQTEGKLTEEEVRQASLLASQVFAHVDAAGDAITADDAKKALAEVNKGREAIKAIRAMLPKTKIRTRTTGPDGKVVYEDDREVQDGRIPLYEGMIHAQTLAPILAARRDAMEFVGYHVVESERIITEAIADLDTIEGHLSRAAKALEQNKTDDAAKALAMALVQGIHVRFSKEDTDLASARDAIWLARRSLEENNVPQAVINLETAKQRLRVHRELASQEQRQEIDQMIREVDQLEAQLRQEGNRQVSRSERAHQGSMLTGWWDRINGWFRRHL